MTRLIMTPSRICSNHASDRDSDSESDFFIPPGPHWQPASASLLLSEAQAGLTSLALALRRLAA